MPALVATQMTAPRPTAVELRLFSDDTVPAQPAGFSEPLFSSRRRHRAASIIPVITATSTPPAPAMTKVTRGPVALNNSPPRTYESPAASPIAP